MGSPIGHRARREHHRCDYCPLVQPRSPPMTNSIESILLRQRQCASDWLIIQARDLSLAAQSNGNTTILVFACLEARNAIEQLWFELLMVIHGGSISHNMFEKCRRRSDGYLAAIGDAEPRYRLLSRFTAIAISLDSKSPHQVIAWDLGKLKKYWHNLSEYCHAQAHPAATIESQPWKAAGHKLVAEVYNYFHSEMSRGATGIMKPEAMTRDARMIWDDFAANKIDEDQTRTRLMIVQPLR